MAQRHLWTRAYNSPIEKVESIRVEKSDTGSCLKQIGGRLASSGTVASHSDMLAPSQLSKPRILIARPKTKALNRNDKIRLGLERAYPKEHKAILDQAFAAYYYTNPRTENLPELYELLESGFLDMGIEACGLGQWAIGRPK